LVKPGGYLVTVVPDEDLYEQFNWPSIFNQDHKVTFRLKQGPSWSPVSFKIDDLVRSLPGAEILSTELQDVGYDYGLQNKMIRLNMTASKRRTLSQYIVRMAVKVVKRIPFVGKDLKRQVENIGFRFGVPSDQSAREALAQIQIVARKVNGDNGEVTA